MRILHITYDFGEASAVFRLATQQRNEGHDVFIYCKRGLFSLTQSTYVQSSQLRLIMYIGLNRLDKILSNACSSDATGFYSASLTPANLPNYLKSQEWDVVHIHWVASNFCSLKSVLSLRGKKFLHLHDFWILLGMVPHRVCNASLNRIGRHLQAIVSNRHQRLIKVQRPVLLAPSHWAMHQAEKLLNGSLTIRIAPGFIPPKFQPGHVYEAGSYWAAGRLRLLQVMSGLDPMLKGLDIIFKALSDVPTSFAQGASLLIVGAQVDAITCVNGMIVKFIRPVSEDEMINIYRAADNTVVWSRAETFSQSAAESLACGTPIITHKGLPCANFCDEREGSVVAHDSSPSSCAWALQHARRKSHATSSGQSLYHAETSSPSSTDCYTAPTSATSTMA